MSSHRHPRPMSRPSRSRKARRLVQLGTLCALVGASLSVTTGSAQAVPEQVLQSVRVQVAADGSITAIESQAVRKAGAADPTSEVEDFSPAEAAGQLPVRVLTSYRLGDRSGTDLRDIEGEAGRVVIQVTVQNTTVRPEELSYQSADGDSRTTTALVGTPLTVVGSAQLGEGELSRIVTSNDVVPTEVTSGVVSRGDDGRARVQWAALLAPPRLAPSATFTLVEETADFTVPSFDFSIQPGLIGDTSVAQLVDSAFSDDGNSTVQLESRTISIIGQVNTVLADAGGVLSDIQSTLDRSAGSLGSRTVGELRSGRDRVDSSLTGTISQLQQLDGEIERELESTGDKTLVALNGTLDEVRVLLGDPRSERVPELDFTGGCNDRVPSREPDLASDKTPSSVLYRMRLVGAQLEALTKVSGACTDDIKAGLRATVGEKGTCAVPANAATAICTLETTIARLGAKSQEIAAFGTSLQQLADPGDSVAALRLQLETVNLKLSGLQANTGEIREQGLLAGELVDTAEDLDEDLAEVSGLLGEMSLEGVLAGYGQIHTIATQQLTLLGKKNESDSVSGKVKDVTDRLLSACDLGGLELDDLPEDLPADLLSILTGLGGDCDGVDDLVESLDGQLDQLTEAWTQVSRLTDTNDVANASRDLQSKIDDATDGLNGARAQLAALVGLGEETDENEEVLGDLLDDLDGLYDAGLPAQTNPCTTVTPATAPRQAGQRRTGPPEKPVFNGLLDAFETVSCNSEILKREITTRMQTFTQVVDSAATDVGARRDDTEAARQDAESEVEALTGKLSQRIGDAGRDVVGRVEDKVGANRKTLDKSEKAAAAFLATLTTKASNRLSTSVTASNRDLGATNKQLQADLASVLLDLGTRGADGTGILGTLSSSARRTSLSNATLAGAGQQASAFRSIRGQVLSDIRLQQVQTDRSLELTSQFPSFGLEVPDGSRVLTVFSFHIGG